MGARDIEAYAILTGCRVPVTAHVGLAVSALGDYRVQGRGEDGDRIRRDSLTVPEAGAFAVVMEEVPEQLARRITEVVAIPTIGTGASPACDGRSWSSMTCWPVRRLPAQIRQALRRTGRGRFRRDRSLWRRSEERRSLAAEHVFGDMLKDVRNDRMTDRSHRRGTAQDRGCLASRRPQGRGRADHMRTA